MKFNWQKVKLFNYITRYKRREEKQDMLKIVLEGGSYGRRVEVDSRGINWQ